MLRNTGLAGIAAMLRSFGVILLLGGLLGGCAPGLTLITPFGTTALTPVAPQRPVTEATISGFNAKVIACARQPGGGDNVTCELQITNVGGTERRLYVGQDRWGTEANPTSRLVGNDGGEYASTSALIGSGSPDHVAGAWFTANVPLKVNLTFKVSPDTTSATRLDVFASADHRIARRDYGGVRVAFEFRLVPITTTLAPVTPQRPVAEAVTEVTVSGFNAKVIACARQPGGGDNVTCELQITNVGGTERRLYVGEHPWGLTSRLIGNDGGEYASTEARIGSGSPAREAGAWFTANVPLKVSLTFKVSPDTTSATRLDVFAYADRIVLGGVRVAIEFRFIPITTS